MLYKAKFVELLLLTNSVNKMSPKKSKVQFFSNDVVPNIRNVGRLKQFIESIFRKEGKDLESLNFIFCTDRTLIDINRKYLNHNFYTDVITFDLSVTKKLVIGEIYISLERVKENAQNLNERFSSELHRVIFHGALHLCGYNDKTKQQINKIRARENELLKDYLKS